MSHVKKCKDQNLTPTNTCTKRPSENEDNPSNDILIPLKKKPLVLQLNLHVRDQNKTEKKCNTCGKFINPALGKPQKGNTKEKCKPCDKNVEQGTCSSDENEVVPNNTKMETAECQALCEQYFNNLFKAKNQENEDLQEEDNVGLKDMYEAIIQIKTTLTEIREELKNRPYFKSLENEKGSELKHVPPVAKRPMPPKFPFSKHPCDGCNKTGNTSPYDRRESTDSKKSKSTSTSSDGQSRTTKNSSLSSSKNSGTIRDSLPSHDDHASVRMETTPELEIDQKDVLDSFQCFCSQQGLKTILRENSKSLAETVPPIATSILVPIIQNEVVFTKKEPSYGSSQDSSTLPSLDSSKSPRTSFPPPMKCEPDKTKSKQPSFPTKDVYLCGKNNVCTCGSLNPFLNNSAQKCNCGEIIRKRAEAISAHLYASKFS